MNRKIVAGGGLAATVVLGVASPAAGADTNLTDRETQEVSFSIEGTDYTCTIDGNTQYQWLESDDISYFNAGTLWTGPGCEDVVISIFTSTQYTVGGEQEVHVSHSNGTTGSSSFSRAGAASDVRTGHIVDYHCGQPSVCQATVETTPK